jgi:hypothetical protein
VNSLLLAHVLAIAAFELAENDGRQDRESVKITGLIGLDPVPSLANAFLWQLRFSLDESITSERPYDSIRRISLGGLVRETGNLRTSRGRVRHSIRSAKFH